MGNGRGAHISKENALGFDFVDFFWKLAVGNKPGA